MNVREKNNLDILRFIASTLVLFSHSFSLLNSIDREPIYFITSGEVSTGRVAVIIFFILSGFLISASWESRNSFYSFMQARILRIFPGLAVMLGLTLFAGYFLSTENTSRYISSAITYFCRNLLLYKGQANLIGIFQNNPFGPSVNGSLWTLRLEFTCYFIVGFLGFFKVLKRPIVWVTWVLSVIFSIFNILPTSFFKELLPLLAWFTSGMLSYLYRDFTFPKLWVIFPSALVIFNYFGISLIFLSPIVAYSLLKVMYISSPFVNFGKYGDFSYGIYIYAFPIQQFIIYLMTKSILYPMAWWVVFIISLPLTIMCAIASWYWVEKRALGISRKS